MKRIKITIEFNEDIDSEYLKNFLSSIKCTVADYIYDFKIYWEEDQK